MGSVAHVDDDKNYLVKEVHRFSRLGVRLEESLESCFMVRPN